MDTRNYKQYHESFMQNNNGTSMTETFLIIITPYFIIFHVINFYLMLNIISNSLKFLLECITIVMSVILSVTILNDSVPEIVVTLLIITVVTVIIQIKNITHEAPFIQIPTDKPGFISHARGLINLITGVCILAVDFQCFPRKLAKTETFGFGLMDVGVGLYVFSNGWISKDTNPNRVNRLTKRNLKNLLLSCSPLFLLGLIRFLITHQINYQEHVSEYGTHWNFFITLAITRIISTLIISMITNPDNLKFVSIVITTVYEIFLQLGLAEYVLSNNILRNNFINANKEGIFSIPGYVAIYITSVYVGHQRKTKESTWKVKEFIFVIGKISLLALCLWKMVYVCNDMFGISRRLANIGYVIWIIAISTTMTALFMLLELFYFFVKFDKTKSEETVGPYGSLILRAINYNGLLFFLTANLLTGFVNIIFQTMLVNTLGSVIIISAYMFILCILQTILYVNNAKFKFW